MHIKTFQAMVGKYEREDAVTSIEVAKKIADALIRDFKTRKVYATIKYNYDGTTVYYRPQRP